jgi:hypothetical protein
LPWVKVKKKLGLVDICIMAKNYLRCSEKRAGVSTIVQTMHPYCGSVIQIGDYRSSSGSTHLCDNALA